MSSEGEMPAEMSEIIWHDPKKDGRPSRMWVAALWQKELGSPVILPSFYDPGRGVWNVVEWSDADRMLLIQFDSRDPVQWALMPTPSYREILV